MTNLAHPVRMTLSRERLAAEFIKLRHDLLADPLWHFEIAVHNTSLRNLGVEKEAKPPALGAGMVPLALFNRKDPLCDIEVFGQLIEHEIDPADALDLWLENTGAMGGTMRVASRERVPAIGGAVGDVVGTWSTKSAEGSEVPFAGRFFCIKAGPRLALMWCRTLEKDYARLADEFFVSLATFRFTDETPGPLAEKVQWINATQPVTCRIAVPVSWKIQPEPGGPAVASFQASLHLPAANGPRLVGKLSLAITAPSAAANHEEAFAKAQQALRDAGVVLAPCAITAERGPEHYLGAWSSMTTATIGPQPAEVRCRVLQHPKAWVVAAVLGPTRAAAPGPWMRAKRVLDIVTGTLGIS